MTAAQTLMVATAVLLGGVAIGALIYRAATQHVRGIYDELGIPFTDDELVAKLAAEEDAIAEALAIANEDRLTALHDLIACQEIERAEGWSA